MTLVLKCIEGYTIPFDRPVLQNVCPKNDNFSNSESQIISKEIQKLIELGAVAKRLDTAGQSI